MYIAVAESKDGTWFDDPIGADTRDDARAMAESKWGANGRLPDDVEVVVYRCSQVDVLDFPKSKP